MLRLVPGGAEIDYMEVKEHDEKKVMTTLLDRRAKLQQLSEVKLHDQLRATQRGSGALGSMILPPIVSLSDQEETWDEDQTED